MGHLFRQIQFVIRVILTLIAAMCLHKTIDGQTQQNQAADHRWYILIKK
ncbi:hypothetical protein Q7C_1087 [Methylophaga frappieri]|uniref:Uncharacterized protein n=1 Tax=Methylophaga frappieri (strain ATCC BAA-2434 / DSM 25690 / JAM7) TaxID=754477 RepID=I1YH49_METFJ|nr:hypothetical protein Q7C_1087 [Methylophaga frappieri]